MSKARNHIEQLDYFVEEVAKEIFLIHDFITQDEAEMVFNQIESSSEEDWTGHYWGGLIANAERQFGRTDVENLIKEGLVQVTEEWMDKTLSLKWETSNLFTQRIVNILNFDKNVMFDGIGTIQRQYSGVKLTEHVDNHSDPGIKYAVVIYLNDDYNGGEVFFSKLNFETKPPKYSMLLFPSGEEYWHGVKPVKDGPVRYVMPSFARIK